MSIHLHQTTQIVCKKKHWLLIPIHILVVQSFLWHGSFLKFNWCVKTLHVSNANERKTQAKINYNQIHFISSYGKRKMCKNDCNYYNTGWRYEMSMNPYTYGACALCSSGKIISFIFLLFTFIKSWPISFICVVSAECVLIENCRYERLCE